MQTVSARYLFVVCLLGVVFFVAQTARAACYQTQTFPSQTICTEDPPASGGGTASGSTGGTSGGSSGGSGGVGSVGSAGSPPQTESGGPVVNLKFDETSGTTVFDSSGQGNNGILENGATRFVGTQNGNKLVLDGVDDRVIISPVSASATNMNTFTVMAWVRPSRNGGTIMRKGNTDVARFNFGVNPQGMLYIRVGHTGATGAWNTTQALPVDAWSHVAVTFTSGSASPTVYIGGISAPLSLVTAPVGEMVADTPYIFLGNTHNFVNTAQAGGSSFFSGRMDDVRIYNFALSSDAINSAKSSEPDASTFTPIPMPWNPVPAPAPTTPQGIVTYVPPTGSIVPPVEPTPPVVVVPAPPTPFVVPPVCPNLSRNLSRGSRGTDVTELQRFLISKMHLAAGNDTGLFGLLTEAAVKEFQCSAMRLCSGTAKSNGYGAVGPQTRAAIAAACLRGNTPLPPSNGVSDTTTGWVEKISAGDGVIRGWAADRSSQSSQISVNIYVDGTQSAKGTLIGTARATAINKAVEWESGIAGNHGFVFQIPTAYFDNRSHTYSVEPIDAQNRMGPMLGGVVSAVTLAPSAAAPRSVATDASCLSSGSRCASYGNDYLAPNHSLASGQTDGVNYFAQWQCTSASGINNITKLNIVPYGTHANTFQKDSLFVDSTETVFGSGASVPTLYFTSSSYSSNSTFSLKKAVFNVSRWNVYSVLDNPLAAGGVSSQDGRGVSFIMNDYSLPGWGPSSPVPGSSNSVPGVSNTSAGTQIPSYALVGSGPLGLTTITNTLHSSTVSGGVEGRTCIHMNPKLFDYDANGRPQSMLVNIWQNTIAEACPLPAGAPIAKLPAPGTYVYRYKGTTLGWQLDLATGLVKDSVTNDSTNRLALVYKPINGTRSSLTATWDGEVIKLDMDAPATSNGTKLLDCAAPGVHLGEATGNADNFYFLASPPGQPLYLSQSPDIFYADIYYASRK